MHGKKVIKNSLISIIYKFFVLIIGFVTRKIFIVYLGKEILGLNSLYANLLDLLNLADLGIGVAVQYQLYEHLVKKDYDKLSKIVTASKRLYNMIGFFIIIAGIILSIFIHLLIKENTYPVYYIRSAFLINVIGIALGYFFVHKRLFLQADENIGLVNIIDLIAKLVTVTISLVSIMVLKNYLLYLGINALYGLTSNLIISYIFNKKYSYIKSNVKEVDDEKNELTSNLKNVIPIKLSNYIYNSTDNIIISKIIGLSMVALYTNYMTIINGIMSIEYLLGNAFTPTIGKMIKENQNDKTKVIKFFDIYQYFQYIFSSIFCVGLAIVGNIFIKWWLGEEFILQKFAFILLCIDFFIHSMYQPVYVVYSASGLFKDDKIVTTISAILNIVLSIILVNIIGLPGVILGTLITDIYIWIVRTYQIIKKFFNQNIKKYTAKMITYVLITLVCFGISFGICQNICIGNVLVELFVKGIICVSISMFLNVLCTFRNNEFASCVEYAKSYIKRRSN